MTWMPQFPLCGRKWVLQLQKNCSHTPGCKFHNPAANTNVIGFNPDLYAEFMDPVQSCTTSTEGVTLTGVQQLNITVNPTRCGTFNVELACDFRWTDDVTNIPYREIKTFNGI